MRTAEETLSHILDTEDRSRLESALRAFDAVDKSHVDPKRVAEARDTLAWKFPTKQIIASAPYGVLDHFLSLYQVRALIEQQGLLDTDPAIGAADGAFFDALAKSFGKGNNVARESRAIADLLIPIYRSLDWHGKELGETIKAGWLGIDPLPFEDTAGSIIKATPDNRQNIIDDITEQLCHAKLLKDERAAQGLTQLAKAAGMAEAITRAEQRYEERKDIIPHAMKQDNQQEHLLGLLAKEDLGELKNALKAWHYELLDFLASTPESDSRVQNAKNQLAFLEAVGNQIGLTNFETAKQREINRQNKCAGDAIYAIKSHWRAYGVYSGIQMHEGGFAESRIGNYVKQAVDQQLTGKALAAHWAELGHEFATFRGSRAKRECGVAGVEAIVDLLGIRKAYESKLAELNKKPELKHRPMTEEAQRDETADFRRVIDIALKNELAYQQQLLINHTPLTHRLDEEQCNMLALRMRNCAHSFDPSLTDPLSHLDILPLSRQMKPSMDRIKADVTKLLGIEPSSKSIRTP